MKTVSAEDLPDMWKATYDLVAQVPEGRVTTYGEVAKALGDVVASRFVGLAMSRNEDTERVPCRRVIRSDGTVGGQTDASGKKRSLLRKEGIRISGDKVVDFQRLLFTEFKTEHPLRSLRARQVALRKRLVLDDPTSGFERVAGIDVAYAGEHAYAGMVVFDLETGMEVDRHVTEGNTGFPYIPTYLAFREIPAIREMMSHIGGGTVVMYDGNGTLHPEGFGIASHVGVIFDVPTIGVAKKLLCGAVRGNPASLRRPIVLGRKVIGHALSSEQYAHPVFVSPGHHVAARTAVEIASRFMKHRVPEPTRAAHILAGSARRGTNNK